MSPQRSPPPKQSPHAQFSDTTERVLEPTVNTVAKKGAKSHKGFKGKKAEGVNRDAEVGGEVAEVVVQKFTPYQFLRIHTAEDTKRIVGIEGVEEALKGWGVKKSKNTSGSENTTNSQFRPSRLNASTPKVEETPFEGQKAADEEGGILTAMEWVGSEEKPRWIWVPL